MDVLQDSLVGGEPADGEEVVLGEPSGGFVLEQVQFGGGEGAPEAVHGEVKTGVVPFHRADQAADADVGVELLAYFAHQGLLRRLARLHLPSGELPPVLEFPVAALGCEYPAAAADYCGDDFDVCGGSVCLHRRGRLPVVVDRPVKIRRRRMQCKNKLHLSVLRTARSA